MERWKFVLVWLVIIGLSATITFWLINVLLSLTLMK